MKLILHSIAFVFTLAFASMMAASYASAQEKCLEPGKLDLLKRQIAEASTAPENANLKSELVKLAQDLSAAATKARLNDREGEAAKLEWAKLGKMNSERVCSILNSTGWPKRASIGLEGTDAFLYLLAKSVPVKMQVELYPLVADAYSKGEVAGGEVLASYIDRLRLALGRKQLYGSQVTISDGFLVMAPIERAGEVDKRRAEFRLQPLRSYERFLEISYRMPLIRSVMEPVSPKGASGSTKTSLTTIAGISETEEEPLVNIDTAFVTLDVVIPDTVEANAAALEKGDFKVYENDKPVEIESFAKAETPFDIVLLLDLSGSTANQLGLIRKTTKRFVEMKRPNDRVAVVAFHDTQTVVSELEADKEVLLKRIKDIDGHGASRIWDALKFGLDMLEQKSEKGRRKAIVLMSDGADNSLTYYSRIGSRIGFADLVETVQRSSTAIFPIYLDTEGPDPQSKKVYADARLTLNYLADQSAGNMYYAKKIDDLSTVYDRVLKDVGTVYSLGFSPDDETSASKWRTLRVEISSRPGLKIKHRPGYFVK